MKKTITILLTIIYLIPAIGFSLNIHWCGKKLNFVSLNSSHQKKCSCGKKMPLKCCKDVFFTVKITDNQKSESQVATPKISFIKQLYLFHTTLVAIPSSKVEVFDFTNYHAPPFKIKLPVYLTISAFRI